MSLSKSEVEELRNKGKRLCYHIDKGKAFAEEWINKLPNPYKRRARKHLPDLKGVFPSAESVIDRIKVLDPVNFKFWSQVSDNICTYSNNDLHFIYSRLTQLEQTDEVKESIAMFDVHNKEKYNSLLESLQLLQSEFFELDENKKIKTIDSGKGITSVFREGKTFEDYIKKYNEIMQQPVKIKI